MAESEEELKSDSENWDLSKLLATILHLGNVEFMGNAASAQSIPPGEEEWGRNMPGFFKMPLDHFVANTAALPTQSQGTRSNSSFPSFRWSHAFQSARAREQSPRK